MPLLQTLLISKDHPFRNMTNFAYLLTADCYPNTEMITSLEERGYLDTNELAELKLNVGEVVVMEKREIKLFGLVIKPHFDTSYLRADLNKCLRNLSNLIDKFRIRSLIISRELDMMNLAQTAYYIERLNHYLRGKPLRATFYYNNLPIPPVEERYKLIKNFHENPLAGHKGMTKTLEKLAAEYYWKNQRSEVQQFIRGCPDCQKKKKTRVKTRLPMLITDTPARAFDKVSIDFHGPLEATSKGNTWILTIIDLLTKWFIAVPLRTATAADTARALVDNLICPFGPPLAILTDQGTNFQGKVLEGFVRILRIEKYRTTAFHPQSSGSIERSHDSLVEYIKQYSGLTGEWDEWLPLATHAHNKCRHESSGYTV